MRIGITSPIVTRVPGVATPWETTAGIAELSEIASAADELGFEYLSCSEHVAVPVPVAEQRGGVYWDPLATFGYLAARTRRIKFLTQVLVLGYHHPLEIAKRYGTLDALSDGRVILGLGVGSLREEFDLLDAQFDGRGERADDAMRALRAAWGRPIAEYHGPHYDFADMLVEPHGRHSAVPLWVGGRTRRSLRRAIELGDGWLPFGLGVDQMGEMIEAVDLPEGFDIVLAAGVVDVLGDPDATSATLNRLQAAGATTVGIAVSASSVHDYIAGLRRITELVDVTG